MDHVASTPKGNEVNLDDETRLSPLTGASKTAETNNRRMLEGWEKSKGNWEVEVRNLKAFLNIHAYIKSNTVQFHPVSSTPPNTIGTSRPIALLPSFFLHLEALQVELVEDPPLRHASDLLPRAPPNDSNEVEKPPKNREA